MEAAHSTKECSEIIAERSPALVNSYVGRLEVTGGECKPSNFHWWPIGFKWKYRKYSCLCADKVSAEVYLPCIAGDINNLESNEVK